MKDGSAPLWHGTTINLKQLLLMLVTKLDSIQAEIASTRKPRFFILFLRGGKAQVEQHSTLREVWERLSR